jgi:Trans-aconitate methyltransferase
MRNSSSTDSASFDEYATEYDLALHQGLSVTGEDKLYFARGRIDWLARCLRQLGEHPETAMDFGCGTGSSVRYLLELIGSQSVLGLDVSDKSLEVARRESDPQRSRFELLQQYEPKEEIDLAFCNGVFHHVPVAKRPSTIGYIYNSLRAGGLFALWENNPWNPGTRYVMSRIPFDRDAITLSAPEARRLAQAAGFEILRTDFLFIFPKPLHWLRGLEPLLARTPLGAQYQILCRKP